MDYDRARYKEISERIATDEYQRGGKPFAEAIKELGLQDVPWDPGFGQGGDERIYHFRGFGLNLTVTDYPPVGAQLSRFIRAEIDGLSRKERMAKYWKACQEECDRINAEMDRERQKTSGL